MNTKISGISKVLSIALLTILCQPQESHAQTKDLDRELKNVNSKYFDLLNDLEKRAENAGDKETGAKVKGILAAVMELDGFKEKVDASKEKVADGQMAIFFPSGSEWSGTWYSDNNKKEDVSYKVVESKDNWANVALVNQHGSWNLKLVLLPNRGIKLQEITSVRDGIEFMNVNISGTFAPSDVGGKDRLELG